eukprot:scaffold49182_cov35-Tisochrysis_lutea.AAC.4
MIEASEKHIDRAAVFSCALASDTDVGNSSPTTRKTASVDRERLTAIPSARPLRAGCLRAAVGADTSTWHLIGR